MNRRITLAGSLLILISIVLGAFGAHTLKEIIEPAKLISFETGVRYQFYHGLALLTIGLNYSKLGDLSKWFYLLILSGVLFFSGSIYFLALQELLGNLSWLGPITPIGGMLMIAGWIVFIINLLKMNLK